MRSQILICPDNFHGVVIFAGNLVVNACVNARSKKLAEAKDHTLVPEKDTPLTGWLKKKIADAPTVQVKDLDADNRNSPLN